MKTFSSANLVSRASTANLQTMDDHTSTNSVPHHAGRSMSVPNDHYTVKRDLAKELEEINKKKAKQNGAGDPGKLEFVKVDVDNNMVSSKK